jgi:aldose sugar dehydrogenase
MKKEILIYAFLICFILISCKTTQKEEEVKIEIPTKNVSKLEPKISLETILSDRGIIWGFDFLPNNDIIFTEKTGKLSLFSKGQSTEIIGLPNDINADNQGGLMDVVLHPNFAKNNWIYLSYSSTRNNLGQLKIIRAKLENNALSQIEPILTSSASNVWKGHYGSRMVFDKAGYMFVSIGEGGPSSYGGKTSPNQNAQNTKEAWGKIHRIRDDGGIPADNPVLEGNTLPSSIYSYGHRNPQGLVYNPLTNEIFNTEHGPKGGDEFNQVLKGKNYGWPWISYGVNYDGKIVSESPKAEGMEDVKYQWTPSIGSCGLAVISSDKYGAWNGSYLTGALALQHLSKLSKNPDGTYAFTKLLEGVGRVRNVKMAPDGFIYVSVENPGRIIKLNPGFE